MIGINNLNKTGFGNMWGQTETVNLNTLVSLCELSKLGEGKGR